jgi:hypothetical protein
MLDGGEMWPQAEKIAGEVRTDALDSLRRCLLVTRENRMRN